MRSSSARPRSPRCRRSVSAICSPTVRAGFRKAIGSWRIMAMGEPRSCRISFAVLASRSSRSKGICPPTMRPPGSGTRRRIDRDVIDWPEPDSPTMPSVSPRRTENVAPSTAFTTPRRVWIWVRSSLTSSSASAIATGIPPDGGRIILGALERSVMRALDIHAHLTPQCFWRATDNGGDWHTLRRERDAQGTEFALVGSQRQALPPRARWTPEERLADMDSLGVDVHVVSPYVGFYNYHLDTPVAVATSRATNDEIGEMVRTWPKRFAGLGTVPMQDVKAATAELERCVSRLGLKGVEINDHVNGRTLEAAEFRPFLPAAEQMGAVVF